MTICNDCGGTVIEYDAAAGNGFCVQCGTVVEENTIVSEVTFGETSSGAAMVQGSYVGQGSTHARMGGPYGNRGSNESREQTIANASRKIQSIASVLRLSEVVCLAATRLYTLAVEHKFTKGRKSFNVVAVCLYVACRQKETRNYMLIDFSDLLQVNVFELGHTYLQFIQALNLRLPLVDPSHYISRFATLLEFGDETHRVASDAVRLVQRFDRDWMTKGRRPAGICGAALLLAARMNNFRRSVEEIVQVVKIADSTLRKRLDEFAKTPSGALTLADFRNVWLDEEMDPPAFTKGKEKEEAERQAASEGGKGVGKKPGKKKKKRKRVGESQDEEDADGTEAVLRDQPDILDSQSRKPFDPSLLDQGILEGVVDLPPLFYPDSPDDEDANIDPALLAPHDAENSLFQAKNDSSGRSRSHSPDASLAEKQADIAYHNTDATLAEEVSSFLQTAQSTSLTEALDEAERRRQGQNEVEDELLGLDEAELDAFLLSEEEIKIKERVWVEINKDYLEALAAKNVQQETGVIPKTRKRRKTSAKPRDASTPAGSTAAESVQNLIKKNTKYSKRINYDALKDLFVEGGAATTGAHIDLDDKEDSLYVLDDKSDGEGMVIIEEAGGRVGMAPAPTAAPSDSQVTGSHASEVLQEDTEGDEEFGDEEGSDVDKGEDIVDTGWEDAYEQEV